MRCYQAQVRGRPCGSVFRSSCSVGHEAVCPASAVVASASARLQVRAMSAAFFDDCLVKNGVVTSRGLQTMVAILDKAKAEVTVEELQPNVASLHPTGERT